MKKPMDLIYITADVDRAAAADLAGVDRVMVDLEINGKVARQGHVNSVISFHTLDDVSRVRAVLRQSRLVVRVNPIFSGSREEVEESIERGADILMLPMFTTAEEVEVFVKLIRGRAGCSLLLETGAALARAPEILDVQGIDDVHIGLNDLHLDLGLAFMFEVLAGGLVEHLGALCRARQVRFGFGGIGRIGSGPLKADLICAEHMRLGSSMVILSRDYNHVFASASITEAAREFAREVARLREYMETIRTRSKAELREMSAVLAKEVRRIVRTSATPRGGKNSR